MIVGYQAFLSGSGGPANAGQTTDTSPPVPPPSTPPANTGSPAAKSDQQTITTPPIPVPQQPALSDLVEQIPVQSAEPPSPKLPAELPKGLPAGVMDVPPLVPPGNPMETSGPGLPMPPSTGILPVAAQEPVGGSVPPAGGNPALNPVAVPPAPNAPPPGSGASALGTSLPQEPPQPLVVPKEPAAPKAVPCPWKLTTEILDGRTHLTAQNGEEVKFTISCDKLDVQTPGGVIHAYGKVTLGTDSLEGTCEQLTISWEKDAVVLDKAQLKCKLEGHEAELHAEQLRLRLSRVVTADDRVGPGIGP
jgi:hypothetical protein